MYMHECLQEVSSIQ